MSDKTKIEWTDATWNIITGCSVVSSGCKNCYAMKLAGTRLKHHPSRTGLTEYTKNGPVWNGAVRFNAQWLEQPLQWKRPRRIFVCAHGDLFHQSVPDEWIDKVFAVMALAKQHTFQVLTKRPERMLNYFSDLGYRAELIGIDAELISGFDRHHDDFSQRWPLPLPNVWLGVSVEDQKTADDRIPPLLRTPSAVRWVSAEPLLGAVDLTALRNPGGEATFPRFNALLRWTATGIDWVVAGGESGANARPMHPDWARSLRDQCAKSGMPFLFKQWGEFVPGTAQYPEMDRVGKKTAGRLLDGIQHDGYPDA